MEGMRSGKDPVATDFCVPAWFAKTVTRADQAYFACSTMKATLVLFPCDSSETSDHGNGEGEVSHASRARATSTCTPFAIRYVPRDGRDGHSAIQNMIGDKPHMLIEVDIQILQLVDELFQYLDKEYLNQQKTLEKTIRNMISASERAAKAKAKKKKVTASKDKGAEKDTKIKKEHNELYNSLGLPCNIPKDDLVQRITEMIAREDALEQIVATSMNAISKQTSIPITRLASEEDRTARSSREKLMQAALEQAKKIDNQIDAQTSDSMFLFGPCAVASSKGHVKIKAKKVKNDIAKDVVQLGKHLMK